MILIKTLLLFLTSTHKASQQNDFNNQTNRVGEQINNTAGNCSKASCFINQITVAKRHFRSCHEVSL